MDPVCFLVPCCVVDSGHHRHLLLICSAFHHRQLNLIKVCGWIGCRGRSCGLLDCHHHHQHQHGHHIYRSRCVPLYLRKLGFFFLPSFLFLPATHYAHRRLQWSVVEWVTAVPQEFAGSFLQQQQQIKSSVVALSAEQCCDRNGFSLCELSAT